MGLKKGEAAKAHVGDLIRRWRSARRMSQLDLALEADISTRHLSYIETGRSAPSRGMVARLAEALHVPLRERNVLLVAAGYAPLYRHTSLSTPELADARHAVECMLAQQEPYPAVAIDRYWDTQKANSGTGRFLAMFPQIATPGAPNGIRLLLHPRGLRSFVENWEDLAARLIQRVHREVAANPWDEKMRCFLDELLGYPGVPSRCRVPDLDSPPPPFLSIGYRVNDSTIRFFSTITTFGTPQDVTLQELRIECFFPADDHTRAVMTPPHLFGEIDSPR